jgi:putative ABC transport system permease protein
VPDRLLFGVLKQVATMALIGCIVGIAAAIGLGRLAGGLLYGLSGHDPLVLISAAGLIGVVVLATSYAPARRASRTAPMQALRYE